MHESRIGTEAAATQQTPTPTPPHIRWISQIMQNIGYFAPWSRQNSWADRIAINNIRKANTPQVLPSLSLVSLSPHLSISLFVCAWWYVCCCVHRSVDDVLSLFVHLHTCVHATAKCNPPSTILFALIDPFPAPAAPLSSPPLPWSERSRSP